MCVCACVSVCLSVYLSNLIYPILSYPSLSIHPSIHLSISLSIAFSYIQIFTHSFVRLCMFVYLYDALEQLKPTGWVSTPLQFSASSGPTGQSPSCAALPGLKNMLVIRDRHPSCPVSKVENHSNPFALLLNVTQILKTRVHLQFQKISDWPIWLLIDPL